MALNAETLLKEALILSEEEWAKIADALLESLESVPHAPAESEAEKDRKPEGQGRIAALVEELAKDPRPFRELSPEERHARLEKIMGVGRGLMSTSEEFARQKLEKIEIEERCLEAGIDAARRQEVAAGVVSPDAGEVETTSRSKVGYLEERAKRGSREKFLAVLEKVPDIAPEPDDEL
jgi:hypothetical protein